MATAPKNKGPKASPKKAAAPAVATKPPVETLPAPAPAAPAKVTAPTDKPGGKAMEIVALTVTSKVEGFRRAGRPWSKTAETVPVDSLSDEQVSALLAEPMLDVVPVGQ